MAEDARFEDAPFTDRPLRLKAESAEDLQVLSALTQDAVGQVGDIKWLPRKKRLVVLMNRFRWEDHEAATKRHRSFERVRSALTFENVVGLKARGISPADPELVFSLLAIGWEASEDGTGTATLTIAGDGELAIKAEALDASLTDLSRPWQATASAAPAHSD